MPAATNAVLKQPRISAANIFPIFLRLGVTCFGGPIAHLGYFREEFVTRRQWISDQAYADLVALCQFLPGPASSEVGIAIGLAKGGMPGALAAWAGFTLPSAVALVLFGLVLGGWGIDANAAWLHGLKVVTVAVVAQALWGMGKSLCPDPVRASIAVAAAVIAYKVPGAAGQIGIIVAGGVLGWRLLSPENAPEQHALSIGYGKKVGVCLLILWLVLLLALPIAVDFFPNPVLRLFDGFYRSGSLVFGGGHVVLPVLQAQVVDSGMVSNDAFLAGYGAAQAIPGPLFAISAYLGAVSTAEPNDWLGAGWRWLPSFFRPFCS